MSAKPSRNIARRERAVHPAEPDGATMRIDLHLHSEASGAATNWWVKGLGLGLETRESYTPPAEAHRLAKAAGMDFVTLTDHETIAGAQTLVSLPDFIVGVEVSALFPEDGSGVDVLVYGVDATAHAEIQCRRGDVYRLVDYLREAGLVHVLAHPLFEIGGPLDRAAVEKRMVLFGLWELINGSRPAEQNRLTQRVAAEVGAIDLRQIAQRHGLPKPPHRRIAGTGGSDDHGGIYAGATWTVVPRVSDAADLLAALAAGEVQPGGEDGSVDKMAQTGFRIVAGAAGTGGQRAIPPEASDPGGGTVAPGAAHSAEAEKVLEFLPLLTMLDRAQIRPLLAGRYERQVANALHSAGASFPTLRLLTSIGSFVDAHLFIAPYIGVHGYFGRERHKTRALRRQIDAAPPPALKAGIFVDELDEIHGVATMYQNLERLAGRPRPDQLCLIRCAAGGDGGTVRLRPVATLPMPLYDGRTLGVPSLLDVLDHVAEAGYDLLHIATPGPLGLAALTAGIILGLPIVGAYHTEFGAYAEVLSGDALVAEIVEALVRQFYERCAVVAVPSASTARALRQRGYQIARYEILRNGVDTALFRPDRRDETLRARLGGGRTLLLYVGRVSREKGLERLAAGYLALRGRRDDVHLVIAGDGPYRKELEGLLGATATFTGFLQGDDLARTVASCDIFVFPSTTDTLGRAVAEAQASGLPAVVVGMGGPRECIRPGASGFVVDPGDESGFLARIETLLDDPALRRQMGAAAHAFAQSLSWDSVLDGLLDLYRQVIAAPATAGGDRDLRPPKRAAPAA